MAISQDFSEAHEAADHGIRAALLGAADALSLEDRTEVEEFLRVGEYGLALEILSSALLESQGDLDLQVFLDLTSAAQAMHLDREYYMEAMGNRFSVQGR